MITTCYSTMSTIALTAFALQRDVRTAMEIELAQRLEVAMEIIAECSEEISGTDP